MKIFIHLENTSCRVKGKNQIRKTIRRIIEDHKKTTGFINIIITGDEDLNEINRDFRHSDYFTDVISFCYRNDNVVEGDVFISIEAVKRNAKEYKVKSDHELNRVIIHGILHLVGYEDNNAKQKDVMNKMEDLYLERMINNE